VSRTSAAALGGRRSALSALGVGLIALMLGAAVTIAYGLGSGFERSARRADLPDVTARFDPADRSQVQARVGALPDLASVSYRFEVNGVSLSGGSHSSPGGVVELLDRSRRGYGIVAGRDLARPGETVVEQGLAHAWGLHVGDQVYVGRLGPQRIVGLALAPDNVAFPLAAPRVYLPRDVLPERRDDRDARQVNVAELWVHDRPGLDALLVQARATSYGLTGLRLVTRAGVRVLVDRAAGLVITLLVAFSAVALAAAGVMLAASAHAEVQRRLASIGVLRAVGASRMSVLAGAALTTGPPAALAAALGLGLGALAAVGPTSRLLGQLDEVGPGAALLPALVLCWVAVVVLVVAGACLPAWQAAGRTPRALLAGAELGGPSRGMLPRRLAGGLLILGARLVLARRARLGATVAVLAASLGFVMLMLSLAGLLGRLQSDPTVLGKRYALLAALPASAAAQVRSLPGVADAAPRYELQALDSFSLGETVDVIAYPGSPASFEDPPLAAGRPSHSAGEAEVGSGLAQALGLAPGSLLALLMPSGRELRARVSGVVRSLDHDGRIAYVSAAALLAADPAVPAQIAVRLAPGAQPGTVSAELAALGATSAPAATATSRSGSLVDALGVVLRVVAAIDGLVCLYVLVQALALTATERRGTVAVLRACGAQGRSVALLFVGAALAVTLPAAVAGVVLERWLLGPLVSRLAAGYVSLVLEPGPVALAVSLSGLLALALVSALWVGTRALRLPVARGLAAT